MIRFTEPCWAVLAWGRPNRSPEGRKLVRFVKRIQESRGRFNQVPTFPIEKSPFCSMLLLGMEKFRIAFYGIIQVVALSYGILATGVVIKGAKYVVSHPDIYSGSSPDLPLSSQHLAHAVIYYHDHGIFLSLLIISWTAFCAYHAFWPSSWNITEKFIVTSGLAMSGFFFILGTFFLLWATIGLFIPYNSV